MPKVKPLTPITDYSQVATNVKVAMVKAGINNISELSEVSKSKVRMSRGALYCKMKKPQSFTVGELKELSQFLGVSFGELVESL